MTLPASGAISLQDLITEFGGGAKLTDFYRGGGLVPEEKTTSGYYVYGSWSSEIYQPLGIGQYYVRFTGNPFYTFVWDGQTVGTSSGSFTTISDGYQYERGTSQGDGDYAIRRRTATWVPPSTDPVNTGVPSSGDISLTDFYGATS